MLIEKCALCDSTDFTESRMHDLDVATCVGCGLRWQLVDMDEMEYERYYKYHYHSVYEHSFEHDYKVAQQRIKAYGALLGGRALDIGCNNGAFVKALQDLNIDADGVDLYIEARNLKSLYQGRLEDVSFPTESYNFVTLHDVLEHVPHINDFMTEVARIVAPGGWLVIDVPNYYSDEGLHHWKKIEHVWLFNRFEVEEFMEKAGFDIAIVEQPIPSKFVIYGRKRPVENRPTILVPPGIGDIYWVMAKLESFLEQHNLDLPEIRISSTNADRNRSYDYVTRVPFVKCEGYITHEVPINKHSVWKAAYHDDSVGVFRDIQGCDYFIAFNGPLRFDKSLEQIRPEYKVDWFHPMFISLEEIRYGRNFHQTHGSYIVAFFTDHGMYSRWLEDFPVEQLYAGLKRISEATKMKIVLTGADWDLCPVNAKLMALDRHNGVFVDLIGQTSLTEFFGLLRSANAVVGYPGGNTIMATMFEIPTVIIWNEFYNEGFWKYSCPTDSWTEGWYQPLNSRGLTSNTLVNTVLDVME